MDAKFFNRANALKKLEEGGFNTTHLVTVTGLQKGATAITGTSESGVDFYLLPVIVTECKEDGSALENAKSFNINIMINNHNSKADIENELATRVAYPFTIYPDKERGGSFTTRKPVQKIEIKLN